MVTPVLRSFDALDECLSVPEDQQLMALPSLVRLSLPNPHMPHLIPFACPSYPCAPGFFDITTFIFRIHELKNGDTTLSLSPPTLPTGLHSNNVHSPLGDSKKYPLSFLSPSACFVTAAPSSSGLLFFGPPLLKRGVLSLRRFFFAMINSRLIA